MTPTPLITYWRGLNATREAKGLPPATQGQAIEAFTRACSLRPDRYSVGQWLAGLTVEAGK